MTGAYTASNVGFRTEGCGAVPISPKL